MFRMAKYMVNCANAFFRICRRNGIFLSGADRSGAVANGLDMNETWHASCISLTVLAYMQPFTPSYMHIVSDIMFNDI